MLFKFTLFQQKVASLTTIIFSSLLLLRAVALAIFHDKAIKTPREKTFRNRLYKYS